METRLKRFVGLALLKLIFGQMTRKPGRPYKTCPPNIFNILKS